MNKNPLIQEIVRYSLGFFVVLLIVGGGALEGLGAFQEPSVPPPTDTHAPPLTTSGVDEQKAGDIAANDFWLQSAGRWVSEGNTFQIVTGYARGEVRVERVGADGTIATAPAGTSVQIDAAMQSSANPAVFNPAPPKRYAVGVTNLDGYAETAGICISDIGVDCNPSSFTQMWCGVLDTGGGGPGVPGWGWRNDRCGINVTPPSGKMVKVVVKYTQVPQGACGNGRIDPGEQCDQLCGIASRPGCPAPSSCSSLGLNNGFLLCSRNDCTFETGACRAAPLFTEREAAAAYAFAYCPASYKLLGCSGARHVQILDSGPEETTGYVGTVPVDVNGVMSTDNAVGCKTAAAGDLPVSFAFCASAY